LYLSGPNSGLEEEVEEAIAFIIPPVILEEVHTIANFTFCDRRDLGASRLETLETTSERSDIGDVACACVNENRGHIYPRECMLL
jgi:hypothetical protein